MKRRLTRIGQVLTDACLVTLSVYLSLFMRVPWEELPRFLPVINRFVLLFVAIRLAAFYLMGVYRILWRYISLKDALLLVKAVGSSSVVIIACTYLLDIRIPRSTFFIDALLVVSLLNGIRVLRRVYFEYSPRQAVKRQGRNTLIFGAGTNGRSLADRLETDCNLGFKILGFIDDDPQKLGRQIDEIPVLGTREDLPDILSRYHIQELVIAVTHLSGETLRNIVQIARGFNIRPRILTDVARRESGKTFEEVSNIELHHLLDRPPRRPVDMDRVREIVSGKSVLVTGAGGSIGSELSRQIFNCDPSRLLLLDHSEFNLYQIDKELRVSEEHGLVVPLLGDIKDLSFLKRVMAEYRPTVVFHAAAYKHVHLVESNPLNAIHNNIIGTQNLLNVSLSNAVDTFVLISTDKAVNPAGVMGATKRVCEMMVACQGALLQRMYCSVRFGNVFGSSGSLIPLLVSQIKRKEPVTVTHEAATRYFMSVQEAVSLVLGAAAKSQPGDINILRMGDPVKIIDMVKSLIALFGKTESECPIMFTGLRAGEKLHEELYLRGNEINTDHPDILVLPRSAESEGLFSDFVTHSVERIAQLAKEGNLLAVEEVFSLVRQQTSPSRDEYPFSPLFAGGSDVHSTFSH